MNISLAAGKTSFSDKLIASLDDGQGGLVYGQERIIKKVCGICQGHV